MTLNETKNEIAKKHGYPSWVEVDFYAIDERDNNLQKPYAKERLSNEAAELYCQSQKAEVWQSAIEQTRALFQSGEVDYYTEAIDKALKDNPYK